MKDDPDGRIEFTEVMINIINDIPNFKNKILFSGESTFCVNWHNYRFRNRTNAQRMQELHTQHPQKINVWVGNLNNTIIGPSLSIET